eukprot:6142497-Amphidinium_carterae.1
MPLETSLELCGLLSSIPRRLERNWSSVCPDRTPKACQLSRSEPSLGTVGGVFDRPKLVVGTPSVLSGQVPGGIAATPIQQGSFVRPVQPGYNARGADAHLSSSFPNVVPPAGSSEETYADTLLTAGAMDRPQRGRQYGSASRRASSTGASRAGSRGALGNRVRSTGPTEIWLINGIMLCQAATESGYLDQQHISQV